MLQFHSWYQFVTFSIQRRVIFWCFFPNDFPNLEMLFCVSPVFVTEIHHKSSGQSAFQRWFKRRDQAFHSYMKYTKKQMLSMDNPWLMKNRGFSPVIATKAGILDFIKSPWVSYLDPSWPFFFANLWDIFGTTSPGFGQSHMDRLSPFVGSAETIPLTPSILIHI